MNKQKIVVIPLSQYDLEYFGHKEFSSVAEFNSWAKDVEDKLDIKSGVKVFVGEERCIEVHKGRASTQYKLSAAGCGCKGRS